MIRGKKKKTNTSVFSHQSGTGEASDGEAGDGIARQRGTLGGLRRRGRGLRFTSHLRGKRVREGKIHQPTSAPREEKRRPHRGSAIGSPHILHLNKDVCPTSIGYNTGRAREKKKKKKKLHYCLSRTCAVRLAGFPGGRSFWTEGVGVGVGCIVLVDVTRGG